MFLYTNRAPLTVRSQVYDVYCIYFLWCISVITKRTIGGIYIDTYERRLLFIIIWKAAFVWVTPYLVQLTFSLEACSWKNGDLVFQRWSFFSILETCMGIDDPYVKKPLYYKVLPQHYSVLQSITPVLLCTTKYYSSTTKYYSSTTLYYKVLLQYYSVLQSTTPGLHCTTKYYPSTTLYYKVLPQYYSVLQRTTPVLLCTTKYYSSTTPRWRRNWNAISEMIKDGLRSWRDGHREAVCGGFGPRFDLVSDLVFFRASWIKTCQLD